MHSRKRGRSDSTKPQADKPPEWTPLSREDVEELVVKLSKEGIKPSRIGLILRDQYGVGDVKLVCGKKLTKILEEKGIQSKLPEDLHNLVEKAIKLRDHLGKHSKDRHNRRSLHLIESKIRRLGKYYRRSGRLTRDWRYDPEKASILV